MTTHSNMPGRFISDCLECDCDIGEATFDKWGHRATLIASDEQLSELRSRAEFYADPWGGPDGPGLAGLKSSARAILKRLNASSE